MNFTKEPENITTFFAGTLRSITELSMSIKLFDIIQRNLGIKVFMIQIHTF